jgi:hypothetical protein
MQEIVESKTKSHRKDSILDSEWNVPPGSASCSYAKFLYRFSAPLRFGDGGIPLREYWQRRFTSFNSAS